TYASAHVQDIEHTKQDSVFLDTRKDKFHQLALGHAWSIDRHWTIDIALQGAVNDSNIALYDYDRALLKGGLSYVY
ncbi:hypothetical protein ACFL2V_14460, partial [Pseudomonadota bacterium]